MLYELTQAIPDRSLTVEEIRAAADALLAATEPDSQKETFLTAWAQRGETAEELAACAEAFLPRAVDPGVRGAWNGKPLLDCCGTGGGGLNLVNISTGMMFILAALGIPVVKHGNRGMTKKSGSADVLEALGLRIDFNPAKVIHGLEETGCAFLFAPACHPSFAAIAPVRRTLGAKSQRTIFNLLGPLLNPAWPEARMTGVFRREHLALYRQALELMRCPRFTVAYGEDAESHRPLGEASAQGKTIFAGTLPVTEIEFNPAPIKPRKLEELFVTDAAGSARRLLAILSGEEKGLGRETLLLNAAVAAWTHGTAASIEEGLALGGEALDSGRALERLKKWREFSRRMAA
ncbi:MAG TPA: anthranilate phosphoribosyltransferase [Candidatus Methylacidiphilales bacterium]|nr:anthranilate phosphoribosyltransferase [Candidatus Methylacidiphilales bacterium]